MSNRYTEIKAKRQERNPGDTYDVWHETRCSYFVAEGTLDCDCMRADVDYLVGVVTKMQKALHGLKTQKSRPPSKE